MSAQRTLLVGVATAALAMPAVALGATPHSSHPDATVAVGHVMQLAEKPLGHLDGTRPLRIELGLSMRNRAEAARLAQAESTPGSRSFEHFLTPRQVRDQFGPSASAVAGVENWLHSVGFRGVSVASNRLVVSSEAPASTVERAFGTTIDRFRIDGHSFFANTTPTLIPASLSGVVTSVLGLSNITMALPHVTVHPAATHATTAGAPDLTGFTPYQISEIYNASKIRAARKTSVAVITMGDMRPIIKNLRTAERKEHYKRVPVKIVYGGPKKVITYKNPLTGNAEWDLDTQMATMEPKAIKKLYIYDEQTFTDEDVVRGINQFVAQDKAVTASASLGECDYIAWADGAMLTTDESLEEGALQGQTLFASTGDNGSFCPEGASTGVPGGGVGDSWPAEGTWTTAAGGTTTLADSKGHVIKEVAWVGGGGGLSPFETAGDWTIPANVASQANQFLNQGGRGVPDISSDADSNTPVLIYTGGKKPEGVGGTSVSAPTLSGLWARIQGRHHNKLGVASIRFYGLYDKTNPGTTVDGPTGPVTAPTQPAKTVPGFRDITLGANGAYAATPGYDYTTGIGVPVCSVLVKRLK